MIFFINVLKAMAAILITNAHYRGVYPTDLIANGGLLGDVLFFSVSGFLLVNIRYKFIRWYWKKLIRIYPTVWIITIVYILLGFYTFDNWTIGEYLLFPTYYHFIASIILLYIPYFIVIKSNLLSKNILKVMLGLFLVQMIIYLFLYDNSYYHIDTVREPMIRFLFFYSMLLGAYFRINKDKFMNVNVKHNWLVLVILLGSYFVSKLALVYYEALSVFQIVNQIVLIAVLFFIFRCFIGVDSYLEGLLDRIKVSINFIATITLEIYLVQYVIIPRLSHIVFPLNWFVISITILLSAYILHLVGSRISAILDKAIIKGVSNNAARGA
ncbi:acyltransferase [Cytobacillus firmus]|uniref:acyltransferase family protein n=1 Tax=Cytobacillus firmus TaxID=1399 RepID=UPI001C943094|nr:acyltransferase [Cytobacillus firmus]MBY6052625.1 acyltransferase [Cytobacillus firmus]